MVGSCTQATDDDKLLQPVGQSATDVTTALNALLAKLREGPQSAKHGKYDEACDAVLAVIERLGAAQGDPKELLKEVRATGN